MEFYTNLLGLFIGFMLVVWSVWILYQYFQLPPLGKKFKKVHLWFGILMFLIGLADLSKAVKDILNSFNGMDF
ncbi:MAG: DUF308 domain-containing protein [Leptonema sp. (in: bacteria)]